MKFIFETIPLLLFFICFKVYDIYIATGVAIGATALGVLLTWVYYRRVEPMQLITLAILTFLGGATILLKDETFIKYKPSVVYWIMAIVFAISQLLKKPLIQHALQNSVTLPVWAWRRLNHSWVLFFILMGGLNLFVAHHYDTATWVNFKVFGGLGLTFLFIVGQAIFLSRQDETTQ
ncbi:MAG: septation protein A [Legionellales bacterium]|nr:septation protein A [Legionellales bacterium]|tara:strand:+ start:89 stop:619 length:531 start_codon:yes stop_codon:yes gene_type:complete